MTITNQIKILNKKNMQNEAQYDLNRKAAKISALSSNNLDKYDKDDKGLDKDDKKEGLFKGLENIKDIKEEQLQVIKDQGEKQLKELKNIDKNKTLKAIDEISKKTDEANKLLFEFKKINEILDNAELVCTKTDGTKYDFNHFSLPLKFIEKIYKYEITIDETIEKQAELKELINKLNNYTRRSLKKIEEKNRVLKSPKKCER